MCDNSMNILNFSWSVLGIGKQIDILIGNIMLSMGEDEGTNYVQSVIDSVKDFKGKE